MSSANCSGVMLLFLDEEAGDPRELVGELIRLLLPSEACGEVVGLTAPLLPVVLDPRRAADKMLVDRLDPEPARSTNETDQPVVLRRNPPKNHTDPQDVEDSLKSSCCCNCCCSWCWAAICERLVPPVKVLSSACWRWACNVSTHTVKPL